MTSHDSLSPPYTNSRVTGMVQAKCVCMGTCICFYSFTFAIHFFLAISFRFTALSGPDCVRVCLRRISETLAYTGGDRSSGMQFLSLSFLSWPAVWKNARQCVLIYPWCSLPLALFDVAPVVSKWPLTQIICLSPSLSLPLTQSHRHIITETHTCRCTYTHTCTHTLNRA